MFADQTARRGANSAVKWRRNLGAFREAVRAGGRADNETMPDTRDLRRRLDELYGSRLRGLYLFGSRVRGDADDESDLDVLVVLDRVDGYVSELERTSEVFSELSLSRGVSFSRVFVTEAEWIRAASTFLTNVRGEAVPA